LAASSDALLSSFRDGMKADSTDCLRAASASFEGLAEPLPMMRSRRSYSFWK
jgi:hypothetical protein